MFLSTALVTSKTFEVTPSFVNSWVGKFTALQHRGQLFHFERIGARAVQIGAAGAVDGTACSRD